MSQELGVLPRFPVLEYANTVGTLHELYAGDNTGSKVYDFIDAYGKHRGDVVKVYPDRFGTGPEAELYSQGFTSLTAEDFLATVVSQRLAQRYVPGAVNESEIYIRLAGQVSIIPQAKALGRLLVTNYGVDIAKHYLVMDKLPGVSARNYFRDLARTTTDVDIYFNEVLAYLTKQAELADVSAALGVVNLDMNVTNCLIDASSADPNQRHGFIDFESSYHLPSYLEHPYRTIVQHPGLNEESVTDTLAWHSIRNGKGSLGESQQYSVLHSQRLHLQQLSANLESCLRIGQQLNPDVAKAITQSQTGRLAARAIKIRFMEFSPGEDLSSAGFMMETREILVG